MTTRERYEAVLAETARKRADGTLTEAEEFKLAHEADRLWRTFTPDERHEIEQIWLAGQN